MQVLNEKMTELIRTSSKRDMKRLYAQANIPIFKAHKHELKHFIQYMSVALSQLRQALNQFSSDPRLSPELYQVHEYVLSYVHYDDDHLPLEHYGFWGYLDDAYLVGLLLQKVDSLVLIHTRQEREQLSYWLELVRKTLPKQTELLDELFVGLLTRNPEKFHQVFQQVS